jgi:DMSO/TMAO reductase YedYZ molybdopterin-dependent catalytic subunit
MIPLSRRELLRSAPLAAVPFLAGRISAAPPPERNYPGMIVRQEQPRNLEYPFSSLDSFQTPNERFFVRSHFAVPKMDAKVWRLTVEGAVENKLELTLDEVRELPTVTKPITLECAGNGRVFATPAVRGLQWGTGAVSTASWTGILLAALLEKAKVKSSAVEVILTGADKGAPNADLAALGPVHFNRSLPIKKAKSDEVILAHTMNNKELPLSHGFPLRAVVGGWYGVASVKWLTRIIVTEKPHDGFWQTIDYSYLRRAHGDVPEVVPVTTMEPKASIAQPTLDEVVPAGKPYRVFGAAWAGENAIAKVDISTDNGKNWSAAKLQKAHSPFAWVLWEYQWDVPPARGPVKLLARATDTKGRTQPATRDPARRSYMINHVVPVEVIVR